MNEKQELTELPDELKRQNVFLSLGSIVQLMLLPLFMYNLSRTARKRKFVGVQRMSFVNYLEGDSNADILFNVLWQYGIPTSVASMQYEIEDGIIVMSCDFYVPETQSFLADVLLWQWSNPGNGTGLSFRNMSPVQSKNGIPSYKYSDRLYEPIGVLAKDKSLDMIIGNLLFGHTLRIAKVNYSPKKDEVKFTESKKNVTMPTRISSGKSKKAKLGKTYG